MDRFDIQKLRELPIEGVAERLGLQVSRHKALCPFHDDHHASLSFKVSKNTCRCFVCMTQSIGPIDLVMRHLGKDFKEACHWLADEHNVIIQQTLSLAPPYREGSGESRFDATRYERFFERPWLNEEARKFLFEERRLDERVVRWCRLTSWRDRNGTPWLQIPYYDREGKLVGVQNRRLLPSLNREGQGVGLLPRFRFPQGSQCGIYNQPVLNMLRPNDTLYICEGASDTWSMLSAGHKAIAIPSATLLSRKDRELLSGLISSPSGEVLALQASFGRAGRGLSFHMFPDNDAPGERLFLQLKEVLPNLVRHQLPPDCKDFSDYYLKLKNSSQAKRAKPERKNSSQAKRAKLERKN